MGKYINVKIERLYRGLVDVRNHIAKKAFETNKIIRISVKDRKGFMELSGDDITNKIEKISKEFKSSHKDKLGNYITYKLLSYKWNPLIN